MTISNVDSSIRGLSFYTNKKIMFLPVNVAESFNNLIAYDASECSITIISRENFAGMEHLRSLALVGNQIEKIYSDVFEGLENLEHLWMCKNSKYDFSLVEYWVFIFLGDNKIKFLNGKTFLGLTKLKEIQLESNICIDEGFRSSTSLATLQETINEKCAFNEALEKCVDENFYKVTEIGELQDELLRKSEEINKLKRKVDKLNEKIQLLTWNCNDWFVEIKLFFVFCSSCQNFLIENKSCYLKHWKKLWTQLSHFIWLDLTFEFFTKITIQILKN